MKKLLCICLALLLCPLAACASTPERHSAVGFYFDTVVTLEAYAPQEVLNEALSLCATYEALLSKTVEGSDVWRIDHAEGAPVRVAEDTLAVLDVALRVCEASGGAFDITIAPASALWDFKAASPALPDPAALAEATALCDYTKLRVAGDTVTLPAGMSLDLGGVAKGYIADALGAFLRSQGVKSALISLGGNIVTLGTKPDGTPWSIGIADPADPNGLPATKLESIDGSVVTSGDYQRYFLLDGRRYHHILDTRTGLPVDNGVASVTISGPASVWCDAFSTACFALGVEKGRALAQEFGYEALYIMTDGSMVE